MLEIFSVAPVKGMPPASVGRGQGKLLKTSQCSGQASATADSPAPNVMASRLRTPVYVKGLCVHCTFFQPFYRIEIKKKKKVFEEKKVREKRCVTER